MCSRTCSAWTRPRLTWRISGPSRDDNRRRREFPDLGGLGGRADILLPVGRKPVVQIERGPAKSWCHLPLVRERLLVARFSHTPQRSPCLARAGEA